MSKADMKSATGKSLKGCETGSGAVRRCAGEHLRASGPAGSLLHLQRTAGNQAVGTLLTTPRPQLQAQLRIGQPGDAFEREADRVADAMAGPAAPRGSLPGISQIHGAGGGALRRCARCGGDRRAGDFGGPPAATAAGALQRKCQCEQGKGDELMQGREAPGATPHVPAGFTAQLAGLRGGGAPLSPAQRGFFEPRFGHDFGAVRLHTGALAESSAEAVRARAFTLGNDVVFGRGEYAPDSPSGRHLLAHELTHVVQQTPLVARRQPLVQRALHTEPIPDAGITDAQPPDAGAAKKCLFPGVARTLNLQPVFLRKDPKDNKPTGATWTTRLSKANTIWGKLGVTFKALAAIIKTTPLKTSGASKDERDAIRALRTGAGVEVFLVDNDLTDAGGGATLAGCGAGGEIVLSDRGTSPTLLAHELGHTMGLDHPGEAPNPGAPGTIMEPSASNSTANPTLNTMANYYRIRCPASAVPTCLQPDAPPLKFDYFIAAPDKTAVRHQ
jgi:hypothetical protein